MNGTTADSGPPHKQTKAFLEDSKCHRKPWWASLAENREQEKKPKRLGIKGDVALWFKAGETKK